MSELALGRRGPFSRSRRVLTRRAGWGIAALSLLTLTACDLLPPNVNGSVQSTPAPMSSPVRSVVDTDVPLTLYFRSGTAGDAMLVPVIREVEVSEGLPQRALEMLLAGPTEADGRDLYPPLPTTTTIRDFAVDGGTAAVDLSAQAMSVAEGDEGPRYEALALAALANTLTEFPAIERVEVTVEGEAGGGFWGGWGMPEVLMRDTTLVERANGDSLPELNRFIGERQVVGTAETPAVDVPSVRVRDRITYLRIVVEVADSDDGAGPAPGFPLATARMGAKELILEVAPVASIGDDAVPEGFGTGTDPSFDGMSIGPGARRDSLRLTVQVADDEAPQFYLHTKSHPTRIVLDVKK